MPEYTVRWILGRALSNPAFRKQMAHDPENAWKDYDLTEDDVAKLRAWTPERVREFLSELEQKVQAAVYDGSVGFALDDAGTSTNCADSMSLEELKKLFSEE